MKNILAKVRSKKNLSLNLKNTYRFNSSNLNTLPELQS